ncbi:MAG: CoA-binding protein [Gammaproteobacteria bacterium]|nr:CoA-binding protein [Gammaproteobacteria bacterium]NIR84502.1 CoA-binding protein [Gammaproteobacteria bacterium]NIR90405.1 CoA-binding protein [Gammaproteobacteria bacterium]NIU05553.1 CoA-binding protein [Gammaproteobacteria bacterium]NIV52692.1 CoA-binding protein [Gammaproteobacteria bacterium]
MADTTDIPSLRRILKQTHTIAMVGLSANWYRPSNFAAKYLLDHAYRVIPVNPTYEEVLGRKCYARVADIPEPIDVVDCFRPPRDIPAIAEEAIAVGASVLWMQLGIVSEEAAAMARRANLEVVMDRCMKIEHARLFGGLNFIGVYTGVISSQRPLWVTY